MSGIFDQITVYSPPAGGGSLSTGSTLWVDAVNGNDTTALSGRADKPFATVHAAIAAATGGDQVLVGPGEFSWAPTNAQAQAGWEDGRLIIPPNVTLRGAGRTLTTLRGVIAYGPGASLEDFTQRVEYVFNPDEGETGYLWQLRSDSMVFPANTTTVLRNIDSHGISDCLVHDSGESEFGGGGRLELYHCNFRSEFDACLISKGSALLVGCTFEAAGELDVPKCALQTSGGVIDAYGCSFRTSLPAVPLNANEQCIRLTYNASTASVRLYGCRVEIEGVGNPTPTTAAIITETGNVAVHGGVVIGAAYNSYYEPPDVTGTITGHYTDANGRLIQSIPTYADDTAADADAALLSGSLYHTTAGGRSVYQKP